MNKKKLIQINTVCNTSTGRIMLQIQKAAEERGYEALSLVGRRKVPDNINCKKIGNGVSFWIHVAITTLFDRHGYGSFLVTKRLIKIIKQENPDIIHLHNIHGYYLCVPLLFEYFKNEFKGRLFWTFHDCWPMTGHCAYFTEAGCERWKSGCFECPNKNQYPVSLLMDASTQNYINKKNFFTDLKHLVIIVPSQWLADIVEQSYMNKYPIEIIPNGIDLDRFHYTIDAQVIEKYGIKNDKMIILGVANVWESRKGLDVFLELSKVVGEEYQIVLVGVNKFQKSKLPQNVIGIERTDRQEELVSLYSSAMVFINPSTEETFSMVTVEAMACGTPVIVLDTSAVKELVNEDCGIVLSDSRITSYLKAIELIKAKGMPRALVARQAQRYELKQSMEMILNLYEKIY
ncbi:MAG: glycosyltransferase [Lachnospiraceae bacterium]|nr:glycosyltransferase [Lachnospiraceae bacterium]